MDSVHSAKLPNSPSHTHINPFSFVLSFFFTFLCNLSITATLLSSDTSCSFSCLLFFCHSVIRPSILPSFLPCVCPALGQCERGPNGWHGSLAHAHKNSWLAPWGASQEYWEIFIYCTFLHISLLQPLSFWRLFLDSILQIQSCCSWGSIFIRLLGITLNALKSQLSSKRVHCWVWRKRHFSHDLLLHLLVRIPIKGDLCRFYTSKCYCLYEKSCIKPSVAPEGAVSNWINCCKWCHLSQHGLGLKTTIR